VASRIGAITAHSRRWANKRAFAIFPVIYLATVMLAISLAISPAIAAIGGQDARTKRKSSSFVYRNAPGKRHLRH
jgi:hypothetical protein